MTEPTCTMPDCDRPSRSRTKGGLCKKHYDQEWRARTGGRVTPPKPCERADCERPAFARGLCGAHYHRYQRGTLDDPRPIAPYRPGAICSVDGCTEKHDRHGLCRNHAYRLGANGDPLIVRPPGAPAGEGHPLWQGDAITYDGAHKRVTRRRGRADAQWCTTCGGPAREWAYIHGSPVEQIDDKTGKPYSADVDDYMPMCAPCHRHYDAGDLAAWLAAPA